MSEYYPVCQHNPCPACGDTSGKCSINEYGYVLFCQGVCEPEVKEGDLRGFWKCFRVSEEYSQWEDQRVALNVLLRQQKARFVNADGQPVDFEKIFDEALRFHREKRGES